MIPSFTERISDSTRCGCVSLCPVHEWPKREGLVNFFEVVRGRVVDDFVCDFERQPGEEIKEYEPLRDTMLMAVGSSSSRFARECSLASKTVRSVLCPSGGGPGRRGRGRARLRGK